MSLDEMQARCDAATGKEWLVGAQGLVECADFEDRKVKTVADCMFLHNHEANAAFIAHARTDMPRLIAALRVLKETSENVGNELCEMFDDNRALQLGASLSVALARATAILETSNDP